MIDLPVTLSWQCATFSDLSVTQLYAILRARSEVFVVEQNCIFQEMDGTDEACQHLMASIPGATGPEVAAYLRIVPPGLKFTEASLGRVMTSSQARGSGIGKQLMTRGLEELQRTYPGAAVRIGAQHYLEKFYQSFGFVTDSALYLEDEIPHVEMLRPGTLPA
jgi:ElaA protein